MPEDTTRRVPLQHLPPPPGAPPLPPPPDRTPAREGRGLVVLVAALGVAVIAVAIVLVVLLVTRGGGGDGNGDGGGGGGSAATSEPDLDLGAKIDKEANSTAFTPTPPDEELILAGIAGSDAGFVAIGNEQFVGPDASKISEPGAVALFSTDGLNWERTGDRKLDADNFAGEQEMRAVTATADGFVAVGGGNILEPGEGSGTAWVSEDGKRWQRIEDSVFDDAIISDVTATDDGLVAVGYFATEGTLIASENATGAAEPESVAAVWRSDDGRKWERVDPDGIPEPEPASGEDRQSQAMRSVTFGHGKYVAVGYDPGNAMTVWTSKDAGTWTPVAADAFDDSELSDFLNGLTATPDGFVAVGAYGGKGATWFSSDGEKWDRTDADDDDFDTDLTGFLSVASNTAGVLVTVGQQDVEAPPALSTIWSSKDGRHWKQVEFSADDPEAAERGGMEAVGVFANGFVAVGSEWFETDEQTAVTTGQIWFDKLPAD